MYDVNFWSKHETQSTTPLANMIHQHHRWRYIHIVQFLSSSSLYRFKLRCLRLRRRRHINYIKYAIYCGLGKCVITVAVDGHSPRVAVGKPYSAETSSP